MDHAEKQQFYERLKGVTKQMKTTKDPQVK